jgi:hypothetical protein
MARIVKKSALIVMAKCGNGEKREEEEDGELRDLVKGNDE